MKIYRHGDVLIKEVTEIPKDSKVTKKDKAVTIALGEATGHHHTLYGGIPMSLLEYNERRFLDIQEEVSLKHQEHYELKISRGKYEITIEQEYDYFEESMKKVID